MLTTHYTIGRAGSFKTLCGKSQFTSQRDVLASSNVADVSCKRCLKAHAKRAAALARSAEQKAARAARIAAADATR